MQGYLLDNNHIEAFFRKEPSLLLKVRTIPADRLLRVCSITLGEIEAGHRGMTQTTDQVRRDEYIEFVKENFFHLSLDITVHTRECYGEIMGGIWQNHPPSPKKTTDQHLVDLGVDINDVWTVASAWEHGLTFVTNDRMACIRESVLGKVEFDCWI